MYLKEIEIKFKIKLSSEKKLEIFITKLKELEKLIEVISDLLPIFRPNIEIDKSSEDYYIVTGKDDPGKFAVLYTIFEEIAYVFLNFGDTPNFYA